LLVFPDEGGADLEPSAFCCTGAAAAAGLSLVVTVAEPCDTLVAGAATWGL